MLRSEDCFKTANLFAPKFQRKRLKMNRLAVLKAFIRSNLCTRHIPNELTPRGHEDWPDKRATRTTPGLERRGPELPLGFTWPYKSPFRAKCPPKTFRRLPTLVVNDKGRCRSWAALLEAWPASPGGSSATRRLVRISNDKSACVHASPDQTATKALL
jgi:hypothetical protein